MNDVNNTQHSHSTPPTHNKHHLSARAVIVAVLLFVLIVSGMFIFSYLKKSEIEQAQTLESDTNKNNPDQVVPYPSVERIDAKHYYIDGVHTLVGEVQMPTPCDLLQAQATVAESYPEQVTINFTVINNSEVCIQKITPQRFSVSARASEDAQFSAVFMGRSIPLNLTPAPPGETPADFELFIKG